MGVVLTERRKEGARETAERDTSEAQKQTAGMLDGGIVQYLHIW